MRVALVLQSRFAAPPDWESAEGERDAQGNQIAIACNEMPITKG
jgi:hypothetical protein